MMATPLDLLLADATRRLNLGDIAGAETILRRASALDPRDPVTTFLLGVAQFNAGNAQAAEPFFRRALANNPDQPKVRLYLAYTLRSLHRPKEAIEHCRAALAIDPHNGDAQLELAKAFEENSDLAEAEALYREILRRRSEPLASVGLAAILNRNGRSEEAEAILLTALSES